MTRLGHHNWIRGAVTAGHDGVALPDHMADLLQNMIDDGCRFDIVHDEQTPLLVELITQEVFSFRQRQRTAGPARA